MSRRGKNGCLTLVGVGFQPGGHVTTESLAYIQSADRLFFLVDDPVAKQWLQDLKPGAVSLSTFARKGKLLKDCCDEMVEQVLGEVRRGQTVCVAFAGHPGVGVSPASLALKRARAEGLKARMVPAVSTVDCLFADLGVDPAWGCQIVAANQLLAKSYKLDRYSALIVFQPGAVDINRYRPGGRVPRAGLRRVVERLLKFYPRDHEVIIYEAAMLPICGPKIERVPLMQVPQAALTPISTLYIPAVKGRLSRRPNPS